MHGSHAGPGRGAVAAARSLLGAKDRGQEQFQYEPACGAVGTKVMRFVSLFAGIGGLDLGLERAGWTCVAQVENNEFCRRILAKHWPDVRRFGDIKGCWFDRMFFCRPAPDAVVGGFPCQDLSSANSFKASRGLRGKESGLWYEFRRAVEELRPRIVVIENSPRWQAWVPEVRADLSALGYASLPVVLSAGSCGAPPSRPRCLVVANSDCEGEFFMRLDAKVAKYAAMAAAVSGPDSPVGVRASDGFPDRMARLSAFGNAVVPQVAEVIGRAINA